MTVVLIQLFPELASKATEIGKKRSQIIITPFKVIPIILGHRGQYQSKAPMK